MKISHAKALHSFARDLEWLLALRLSVQMATVWFFIWGVVILVLRVVGVPDTFWLALCLAGTAPLAGLAVWRAKKQRASFSKIRASYDRWNGCGGVIMAEETADIRAWLDQLPEAVVPKFRWQSGRTMGLFGISSLFVATALLLPERLTNFSFHRPLEIGQTVGQLQAEVKMLAQEKIIPDKKADELQKQLFQLQKDSLGSDPDKTWEALDHIKQSNSDQAKQAAEEALAKTASLAEAETMGQAMEEAADGGMNGTTASQAVQDLAAMLKSAKLELGMLNSKIPPELLAGLNGLNKEQMEKLLQMLESKKNSLGATLTNLSHLRMIDASMLSKCTKAGQCHNPNALAEYLSTCTNGCNAAECECLCSGEYLSRGGPGAPMTWNDGASENDLKFQEHAMPPASHLSDAQLIGVSKATPTLSTADAAAQHGALAAGTAGGGAARWQAVLPEQRAAVRHFFKRDD